jgi:hypothetical protein
MARAKRTDRAEARRQYRAYLAEQVEDEAGDEIESRAEEAKAHVDPTRVPRATDDAAGPRPGQRLGILGAARAAIRTPHYLDDLRNIGPLVFRSRAVWPSALITVFAIALCIPRIAADTVLGNDAVLSFCFQVILSPVPFLTPMMAGFLAPRSTWLAGALSAALAVVGLVVVCAVTPLKIDGTNTIWTYGIGVALMNWLIAAIPIGALLGAAAGWYKRFLDRIGPNQGQAQRKPVKKSSSGRR